MHGRVGVWFFFRFKGIFLDGFVENRFVWRVEIRKEIVAEQDFLALWW